LSVSAFDNVKANNPAEWRIELLTSPVRTDANAYVT